MASIETRATRAHCLAVLEERILWLAVWMIHHANHIRAKRDGLKVGGHQASSTSVVTLMTALYMDVLRPEDRVAVKPHASPVFHAIQYLFGRQSREKLERFRSLGGAQAYPSRTKDTDDVDFSTGSVGLGVAITSFAALVQDYVRLRQREPDSPPGRMIALAGDAELDEGNVFEALLEGWKQDVRNVWWIVDYNRQSLDATVSDRLNQKVSRIFEDLDWRVITLKYGRLMERAFQQRGGEALRDWIDACPNSQYSALAYHGGAAWRQQITADLGGVSGIRQFLDEHDDTGLHQVMTNLGGHDMDALLEAFHSVHDDQPTCFMAYTIKGYGLPFAGHKDNHAGLMTPEQIGVLKDRLHIADGQEWDGFAGTDIPEDDLRAFVAGVPFAQQPQRTHHPAAVPVPAQFTLPAAIRVSTQEGFGRLLATIAREHTELAEHIVTAAPDVTVSTNLGSWVNRRGVFSRTARGDIHADRISSPQKWAQSPAGQHIALGIAENNLFILMAALGLAGPLFGTRLLPIGTVYDPFIARGLDALNYACYQDARFMLVATPSGISLSPEGGAHQSVYTPLIGVGQPGLTAFEPAYLDELCEIVRWSFQHMQDPDGGSVYLRLSTRPLDQPQRSLSPALASQIVDGGYWMVAPECGSEIAIVASGAVLPEALEAHHAIAEDIPGAGLLVITSCDRLERGWIVEQQALQRGSLPHSHITDLLGALSPRAGLVTVSDAHPATLAWLGSVRQHRLIPLGVDRFGQSGDIPDLYRTYGLDANAIVEAIARLTLTQPH